MSEQQVEASREPIDYEMLELLTEAELVAMGIDCRTHTPVKDKDFIEAIIEELKKRTHGK